jgi:very-short-patch-repair endonuclease
MSEMPVTLLESPAEARRDRIPLTEFAELLRGNPTRGEAKVREGLESLGFEFQIPLYGYVVDFLHDRHAVIVEIDGCSHAGRGAEDAERMRVLAARGYIFLRFTEELAVAEPAKVARICGAHIRLYDELEEIAAPTMTTRYLYRYAREEVKLSKYQMDRSLVALGIDPKTLLAADSQPIRK